MGKKKKFDQICVRQGRQMTSKWRQNDEKWQITEFFGYLMLKWPFWRLILYWYVPLMYCKAKKKKSDRKWVRQERQMTSKWRQKCQKIRFSRNFWRIFCWNGLLAGQYYLVMYQWDRMRRRRKNLTGNGRARSVKWRQKDVKMQIIDSLMP